MAAAAARAAGGAAGGAGPRPRAPGSSRACASANQRVRACSTARESASNSVPVSGPGPSPCGGDGVGFSSGTWVCPPSPGGPHVTKRPGHWEVFWELGARAAAAAAGVVNSASKSPSRPSNSESKPLDAPLSVSSVPKPCSMMAQTRLSKSEKRCSCSSRSAWTALPPASRLACIWAAGASLRTRGAGAGAAAATIGGARGGRAARRGSGAPIGGARWPGAAPPCCRWPAWLSLGKSGRTGTPAGWNSAARSTMGSRALVGTSARHPRRLTCGQRELYT